MLGLQPERVGGDSPGAEPSAGGEGTDGVFLLCSLMALNRVALPA